MKEKKSRGKKLVGFVWDSVRWTLVADGAAAAGAAGTEGEVPEELLEKAVRLGAGRARFVLSRETRRIEGEIPDGAGISAARAEMAKAIADETGAEAEGLGVAGMSYRWKGCRKPFTLAAEFDAETVENLSGQLEDAGISCAGFASLELAILAVWRTKATAKNGLVVMGAGSSFVLPPCKSGNEGPRTIACGTRHFLMDRENGTERFRRATAAWCAGCAVKIACRDPEAAGEVREALPEAEILDGRIDEEAWKVALAAKANRIRRVETPVYDPRESRKLFSNAWIAAAALVVLALPVAADFLLGAASSSRAKQIALEADRYRPLERRIKVADSALSRARTEYDREIASGRTLVEGRRPMLAWIKVAEFFCRHTGRSMVLDEIVQSADRITVKGRYSDPEDAVGTNKELARFTKEHAIAIERNVSERGAESAGAAGEKSQTYAFTIVLDCSKVGGDAAATHAQDGGFAR